MRAPAEFIVTRHLLSHPGDSTTQLARDCHLDPSVASKVVKRLRETQPFWTEQALFRHLKSIPERPQQKGVTMRLTNPELWFRSYGGPYMASGEAVAATVDGIDVVPGRFLVYVPSFEHARQAVKAGLDVMGKLAPSSEANLEIRVGDPWLCSAEQPNVVERGQRLLDYDESRQIQLLRVFQNEHEAKNVPRVLRP
jgi:hypothetical protein